MQKDFKIGLILGLALAIAAVLWLSIHPSLSPQARISRSRDAVSQEGNLNAPLKNHDPDEPQVTSHKPQEQSLLDFTVYEQPEKIKTQRFHIVLKGETLSAIAQKYYGAANKWQKIFDANREVIKDANKITPGAKLIIPD